MSTALELESLGDSDLLPPIEDFFALLDRIATENPRTMEYVGGNILIHVRDVAVRTIVTRGAKKGVHKEALDVNVDFALSCEEWVLLHMLDDEYKIDVARLVESGFLYIHGDPEIWDKYLALGEQKSMLSVRAAAAGPAAASPKKKLRSVV
jgi:hypothetical protein